MEILPISRTPSPDAEHQTEITVVKTRRIPRPQALFLLVVVVPVLTAVLYFGFLATDVYVSESRFVVRSPEKAAPTGLGVILQSAGFQTGSDEIFAAQSFAVSRDALRSLNRNSAFENAYSRPEIFVLDRFDPFGLFGSFEDLFQYFEKKVSLKHDSQTSITTLTVRAYDPRDAYRFNERLLEMSEQTVNQLNQRGQRDLVGYAQRDVAEAKAEAQMAAANLAAYRNRSGVVDPEKQAEAQMQMVSKLQDQLIASKAELAQLTEYTPINPRIPSVRTQIATIQHEIDINMGKVTGSRRSLAQTAVQFERLTLESEFANKQLTAALASLEQARSEAQRKQAYVERVVEPNLPDAPMEPRRVRGIIATLLLSLLAYGILRMLLAGIREHAQ
jgi:capsular polysaccharide transport system permease protein